MPAKTLIITLASIATTLAFLTILVAIYLSKFGNIMQGLLLYLFTFVAVPFWLLVQSPITKSLVWVANSNPQKTFYACNFLTEENCLSRSDCQLEVLEGTGVTTPKRYYCAPRPFIE